MRRDPRNALPPVFRRLLIAWFASLTADGMRFAAIPLLALATDPSPAAVAAVAAAMALPWLLVALPAGAVVDRADPARVVVLANVIRALAAGVLVAATLADRVSIVMLAVVAFVLTASETFADGAAQTLLIRIVPGADLERANARFVSSENIGLDLIGPLVAGLLFGIAAWLPFVVSGLVFLVASALMLSMLGHRDDAIATPGPNGPQPRIRDGFRVVFADPVLRPLVVTVAVMAASVSAMEAVLVVYATVDLKLPATLYPTLLAAYSVGLLASTAFVGRLATRFRAGPVMLAALALIGITLIGLGLFPQAAVAWIGFAAMGAGGGVWNVLSATRRQRRTPRRMVGRVSSTFRAISWGCLPIGAATGGFIGTHRSVPTVFVAAGAVVLVLGTVMAATFWREHPALVEAGDDSGPSGVGAPMTLRIDQVQSQVPPPRTGGSTPLNRAVEDEERRVG